MPRRRRRRARRLREVRDRQQRVARVVRWGARLERRLLAAQAVEDVLLVRHGALARVATTESLEANQSTVFMRFALTLFRLLCFGFGVVKAALKAIAAAITTRPADRGGAPPPLFQLQVKVDGATVMLDAGSAWTAAEVKAALHAKTGRAGGGY